MEGDILAWSDRFSVGIPIFDAEHLTLLSLFNQLQINLGEGGREDAVRPTLVALSAIQMPPLTEGAIQPSVPELRISRGATTVVKMLVGPYEPPLPNGCSSISPVSMPTSENGSE